MKDIRQIERKMKSLGSLANEFYEELKLVPPKKLQQTKYVVFIIEIRNQMKLLSWVSGISYKKYLPKGIK